ncbi:SGNH/GDSL hydrolase family protein, partial [Candidatus Uhrbacteria bacterium]|nr:SGNH/GDSL hydrolase family protein [Candidatus Uhrbacteria bacterium]
SLTRSASWRFWVCSSRSRAKAFSRAKPDAKFHILVIGDSTAVGTGAEDPSLSIAGRLGADFPEAEIVNLGVNGARTKELLPRLAALKGRRFELILIQVGANDIVHGTNLTKLEGDIARVMDAAARLGKRVLLLTSGNVGTAHALPIGTRWFFTRRTRQVRELFMRIAKEKDVRYVDLFREPDKDPFALDPMRYYAADWYHPSGEGYRDWYDHIKAELGSRT